MSHRYLNIHQQNSLTAVNKLNRGEWAISLWAKCSLVVDCTHKISFLFVKCNLCLFCYYFWLRLILIKDVNPWLNVLSLFYSCLGGKASSFCFLLCLSVQMQRSLDACSRFMEKSVEYMLRNPYHYMMNSVVLHRFVQLERNVERTPTACCSPAADVSISAACVGDGVNSWHSQWQLWM